MLRAILLALVVAQGKHTLLFAESGAECRTLAISERSFINSGIVETSV